MSEKNQISNLPVPSVGGLSVYLAQLEVLCLMQRKHMLAKN